MQQTTTFTASSTAYTYIIQFFFTFKASKRQKCKTLNIIINVILKCI